MTVGNLTALMGERVRGRVVSLEAVKFLGLTLQLGLALLVIRSFALEGPVFYRMILLASAGFLVNAILPLTYRQSWFILVSLAAVCLVFGLTDGLWLITIGLGLIGLCHLPVSWGIRAGLVLAVAVAMALSRGGLFQQPFSSAVWPILGSMFMFRLIVYLHHLRHHPKTVTAGRSLAYFFMLPNVSFPLFPVVDYKTFDATYYDQDALTTYQAGLRYIARGLVHLVLYRFVYYYVVRDPSELANLGDVLTYVVSAYLVYLRVSGQFHIIIGVLHLFGYRLPPANNLYFLATGFTEIWRRNNIYWKDFMMKLVYYPSFFRLRKIGGLIPLVGATFLVIVLTWLFHSYQWFWIRGDFPLTVADAMFWGVIGTFMIYEMVRDARRGPTGRVAVKKGWSLRRALRTVTFFFGFSMLWAVWDGQSVTDFVSMWSVASNYDARTFTVVGLIVLGALAVTGWGFGVQTLAPPGIKVSFWRRPDFQTMATCLGLLAVAQPQVTNVFGDPVTRFAQSLRETKLNARDVAMMQRGYYEQLNIKSNGLGGGELRQINRDRPEGWLPLEETVVYHMLDNFMGSELVPSSRMDFKGALFTTNRWGMRDRNYPMEKPAGVSRLALLGPSTSMGGGVEDSETFENVLEDSLNAQARASGRRYELLNFSIGGLSQLQQVLVLEERAWRFDPDVILLVSNPTTDLRVAFRHLGKAVRAGFAIEDPVLKDIVRRADVDASDTETTAFRKLRPFSTEMILASFRRVADGARARGVPVVLLVMDLPTDKSPPSDSLLSDARRLGFHVADVRDAYGHRKPAELVLARWDEHLNTEGHRLVATRLGEELMKLDSLLNLGLSTPVAK